MTTPVAGTTHQVVLADGTNTIGLLTAARGGAYDENLSSWLVALQSRSSTQVGSGEARYSDLEKPYFNTAQDDWKGGRGQEDFSADKTLFYDTHNINSWIERQLILGPEVKQRIIDSFDPSGNGGITIDPITGGVVYVTGSVNILSYPLASTFTTKEAMTSIRFCFGYKGAVSLTLSIFANSGNLPSGSALGTTVFTPTAAGALNHVLGQADITATLAAATQYWVSLNVSAAGNFNIVLAPNVGLVEDDAKYYDGAWHANGQPTKIVFYVLASVGQPVTRIVPFYKDGPLWAVTSPASGAAKLWRNGDQGGGTANTDVLKVKDTTKAWTADEWIGCTVIVTGPLGQREERLITDNDATTLTVSPAFSTAPTTSWGYGILGADKWTDKSPTGTTLTGPVTDVLSKGGYLWLCQDEAANVVYVTAAGVGADAGFKASLLAKKGLDTNTVIYAAYYNAGAYSVGWADYINPSPGGGDAMDFTVNRVNVYEPVTALVVYDDILYIFTQQRVYALDEVAKKLQMVDIDYFSQSSPHNGVRPTKWNMFLYFPLRQGLERLFGKQVDDIGPNRGTGLPSGRQGYIVDGVATVGNLFMALDAGDTDTSAVLVYNGLGWHELARAQTAGQRIRAVGFEVIPLQADRLWFSEGNSLRYVNLPAKTQNPWFDAAMRYQLSGEFISSWFDQSLAVTGKLFHEIMLLTEGCSATTSIYCYYQTDTEGDASTWHYIGQVTTSPIQMLAVSATNAANGYRVRFKFLFQTANAALTPRLKAFSVKSVAKMLPKRAWSFDALLDLNQALLDDSEETVTPATVLAQLVSWAGSVLPLTMTCVDPASTGSTVLIDSVSYQARSVDEDKQANAFSVALHLLEV